MAFNSCHPGLKKSQHQHLVYRPVLQITLNSVGFCHKAYLFVSNILYPNTMAQYFVYLYNQ